MISLSPTSAHPHSCRSACLDLGQWRMVIEYTETFHCPSSSSRPLSPVLVVVVVVAGGMAGLACLTGSILRVPVRYRHMARTSQVLLPFFCFFFFFFLFSYTTWLDLVWLADWMTGSILRVSVRYRLMGRSSQVLLFFFCFFFFFFLFSYTTWLDLVWLADWLTGSI